MWPQAMVRHAHDVDAMPGLQRGQDGLLKAASCVLLAGVNKCESGNHLTTSCLPRCFGSCRSLYGVLGVGLGVALGVVLAARRLLVALVALLEPLTLGIVNRLLKLYIAFVLLGRPLL